VLLRHSEKYGGELTKLAEDRNKLRAFVDILINSRVPLELQNIFKYSVLTGFYATIYSTRYVS
jgi:hypothetical protein